MDWNLQSNKVLAYDLNHLHGWLNYYYVAFKNEGAHVLSYVWLGQGSK